MASFDPWTSARLGDMNDAPAGGLFLAEVVNELGKWVSPPFGSGGERDSALTAWAANGNTVSDGMQCSVAGFPQILIGGTWHGIRSVPFQVTAADGTIYTDTHAVMTQIITDPGVSYKIAASGAVLLATIGTGVTVAARVRVNGTALNPLGPNVSTSNNSEASTWGMGLSGVLTGASTVTLSIEMIQANAGFGYQAATSASQNSLMGWVIPV